MAWKVLSNLKTDILHKVGEVLQTLEGLTEDEIKKLEREGIIQNLETDAKTDAEQVKTQVEQDLHTAENQAVQDEELARGQVDSQVAEHANQDVADAAALAQQQGEVVNGGGQPSAEDIQKTAESVA